MFRVRKEIPLAVSKCNKNIPLHLRKIKCDSCNSFFHVKCCGVNYKSFNSLKEANHVWHCKNCVQVNTVVNNTETPESSKSTKNKKKCKCGKCLKVIRDHLKLINCDTCLKYYHVKCSGTTTNKFLEVKGKNEKWACFNCISKSMPFSNTDNNELYLEMENKANLVNSTPSFSIQSLLDEMPGQNFETDEFMSQTISSKYFTPAEFLECKLPSNKFSMLHINISSLSKHIDELRNLLLALSHPFDVIGVTETRLHSWLRVHG